MSYCTISIWTPMQQTIPGTATCWLARRSSKERSVYSSTFRNPNTGKDT